MRNIRGQAKRETEYYRSNPLQRCQVCGRLFTLHAKDRVCSIACAEMLKAQQLANATNLR